MQAQRIEIPCWVECILRVPRICWQSILLPCTLLLLLALFVLFVVSVPVCTFALHLPICCKSLHVHPSISV